METHSYSACLSLLLVCISSAPSLSASETCPRKRKVYFSPGGIRRKKGSFPVSKKQTRWKQPAGRVLDKHGRRPAVPSRSAPFTMASAGLGPSLPLPPWCETLPRRFHRRVSRQHGRGGATGLREGWSLEFTPSF